VRKRPNSTSAFVYSSTTSIYNYVVNPAAAELVDRRVEMRNREYDSLEFPAVIAGTNPPPGTYLYARSAMVHTSSAATASRCTVALLATEH